ncbi:MAG: hypothetical protein Phyf2KO_24250 [Phycisphaerales bacterium]
MKQPLQRGSWVERTDELVVPDSFPPVLARFYSKYQPPPEYPDEWEELSFYIFPADKVRKISTSSEDLSIPISHQRGRWEQWLGFDGYIIGRTLFFEDVVYFPETPVLSEGGIYFWGVDVAGPQESELQPWFVLCVSSDFNSWQQRLLADDWLEYGVFPGNARNLSEEKKSALALDFCKLNAPGLKWLDCN